MDLLHYPVAFIAVLGVLVTIHEFGHYLVARLSGVGIERFSVGFGRPLWSKTDTHGTQFTVAMIPLGGYVRMYDDRDLPEGEVKRTDTLAYMDLDPKWRIAIALGGPFANFILAIVVYWALLIAGSTTVMPVVPAAPEGTPAAVAGLDQPVQILGVDGQAVNGWQDIGLHLTDRLGETGTIELQVREVASNQQRTLNLAIQNWHEGVGEPDVIGSLGLTPTALSLVGDVIEGSPAQRDGLQTGDYVVAVDDVAVQTWGEWVEQIQAHPNQRIGLTLYRDGQLRQLTVTPAANTTADGQEVGSIGVYRAAIEVENGVFEAVPMAVTETWDKSVMILSIVKKMITGQVSVKNLSGPISIAQVAGDSAKYSWRSFVGILAFLSVSLGVFNLLPIPILDGGHVVFNTAEWITGKPVSERVQVVGIQVGLLLVGTLMVFATYNDILRLF